MTEPNKSGGSSEQKIQGEGDYESARRFNKEEREFVKEHGTERPPTFLDAVEEEELEDAEEETRARGPEREHDPTDEALFKEGITRRSRRPQ